MTVVKKYNSGTSQWEAVVVGKQGPPALSIQTSEPAATNVLWIDTDAVSTNPSISTTIVDAKGDLIVGTGSDSVARLPVSATDGLSVVSDSSQTTGLKYEQRAKIVNTDGDSGVTIFVGSIDPDVAYTPSVGDVWIEPS